MAFADNELTLDIDETNPTTNAKHNKTNPKNGSLSTIMHQKQIMSKIPSNIEKER